MSTIVPWIKALHVLSMSAFVGGMLAAPTLLAASAAGGSDSVAFARAARVVLRRLVLPAMIATLFLGVALIGLDPSVMRGAGWLHAKLLLVFVLLGGHGFVAARARKAESGVEGPSASTWIAISAGFLAMFGVVMVLVVVRPF